MSELFADDYPMSVDNRHSNIGRCGMEPWLYVVAVAVVLVVVLAGLIVWGRYFGGDDPPG